MLKAMAFKEPIVTTDHGNYKTFVHSETGIKIEKFDVTSLLIISETRVFANLCIRLALALASSSKATLS
jgi:hypothetical protein